MANGYINNPWNPEQVEILIRLVREGYSGGVIANRLGLSRNSVIGKVHRLGMHLGNSRNSMQRGLASQLRLKANYDRRRVVKPRIPVIPRLRSEPLPSPAAEDLARKSLLDLNDGDCRYVVGEPTGVCFCALPQIPGSSYCLTHAVRCTPNATPKFRTSAPVKQTVEA